MARSSKAKKDSKPQAGEEAADGGLKLPVPGFLNKTAGAGGEMEKEKKKEEGEKQIEKKDAVSEAATETMPSDCDNFVFQHLLGVTVSHANAARYRITIYYIHCQATTNVSSLHFQNRSDVKAL